MRMAALIIGIFGGLAGIVMSLFALGVGALGQSVGQDAAAVQSAATVGTLGWVALGLSFVGFLGAGVATGKPGLAALILLVAAVGIVISISLFGIIPGLFFLVASILAFAGRGPKVKATAPTPAAVE